MFDQTLKSMQDDGFFMSFRTRLESKNLIRGFNYLAFADCFLLNMI
jgi:hypothetical protein